MASLKIKDTRFPMWQFWKLRIRDWKHWLNLSWHIMNSTIYIKCLCNFMYPTLSFGNCCPNMEFSKLRKPIIVIKYLCPLPLWQISDLHDFSTCHKLSTSFGNWCRTGSITATRHKYLITIQISMFLRSLLKSFKEQLFSRGNNCQET